MPDVAKGTPTKEFFVNMLTRDIELNDAVLDLLDNCLDGVIRMSGRDSLGSLTDQFYNGHYAKIKITDKSFTIEDNCGGIPRDIAIKHAFRMGRPSDADNDDETSPTIGVYGIGMKRAIFKIGETASVLTRNFDDEYEVNIDQDWKVRADWDFPITDKDPHTIEQPGTIIHIEQLREDVRKNWVTKVGDVEPPGITDLKNRIRQSYGLILSKGFDVFVNDEMIIPETTSLLVSQDELGIKPYIYQGITENVKVTIIVGFYAPLTDSDDLKKLNTLDRKTSKAGWTIVCNDRIVLYKDKSHLTGWGEYPVPNFHTQFISITGIVIFESPDPEKLPITTTKRGIDYTSSLYSTVKSRMKEGLLIFIRYTNKWKGKLQDKQETTKNTKQVLLSDVLLKPDDFNIHITKPTRGDSLKGVRFIPSLPEPEKSQGYAFIRFSRPTTELELIRNNIFDESISKTPSEIGEACFDKVLNEILEGVE